MVGWQGVYSLYSEEVFPVSPREMFVGGEREEVVSIEEKKTKKEKALIFMIVFAWLDV